MLFRAMMISVLTLSGVACTKDNKETPMTDPKPAEPAAADTKPAETKAAEPAAAPATGLASIAIPKARTTMDQILTGGQPTDDHIKQAKDQGVKIVVNLRSAAEEKEFATEAKLVEELGMKYVHIPIDGTTGEGLTEENAKKLAELLAGETPMLLHCASGQRVGALLALKAFYVDKAAPDAALQTGKDNGLSRPELEKIVTDLIAKKG